MITTDGDELLRPQSQFPGSQNDIDGRIALRENQLAHAIGSSFQFVPLPLDFLLVFPDGHLRCIKAHLITAYARDRLSEFEQGHVILSSAIRASDGQVVNLS
jgi:hypothetical protein